VTAASVNGIAVVASEPAEAAFKSKKVLFKQILLLLLEDGTEVYGCLHCDYTANSPVRVRPHLGKHTNRTKIAPLQDELHSWQSRALRAEAELARIHLKAAYAEELREDDEEVEYIPVPKFRFTATGDFAERCGYRIRPVKDNILHAACTQIAANRWSAVLTADKWAEYEPLPDDEFAVQILTLGLDLAMARLAQGIQPSDPPGRITR
jgi:hypothetical protein